MKLLLIDGFELVPFENLSSISVYKRKYEEKTMLAIKTKDGVIYEYVLYAKPISETEQEEVLKAIANILSRNGSVVSNLELLSKAREKITELRNPQQTKRGRKKK